MARMAAPGEFLQSLLKSHPDLDITVGSRILTVFQVSGNSHWQIVPFRTAWRLQIGKLQSIIFSLGMGQSPASL